MLSEFENKELLFEFYEPISFFFLKDPPPTDISPLPLPAPFPISSDTRLIADAARVDTDARSGGSGASPRTPAASGPRSADRTGRTAATPTGRARGSRPRRALRSEEHTSELQSPCNLVCRLLLAKK